VVNTDDVRDVYSRVSERYAATFFDELERKPFDRGLLDDFAARCRGNGSVLDLGCGPGHVPRYLAARGVDAEGLDLSPAMVDVAGRRNPGLAFRVGDMTRLPFDDGAVGGLVAFYSIIHLPRSDTPPAIRELRRVLRPGGLLLLAVHVGEGSVHAEEFLGEAVSLDATLFAADELAALLTESDFAVDRLAQRPPYPFEHPTERLYALAVAATGT
jgi:SAM-dependent methyltransferase